MCEAAERVQAIFRELVGDAADRLSGNRFLADVNTRITSALAGEGATTDELLRCDGIGFHVVDWQADAAFIVALSLFPDRFTDEEIQDGIENLLIHAPAHLLEAARLAGHTTKSNE